MKKTVGLKSGFTLLEILLVVGIISILAGIVILAINPTKQLGDTRNAQRRADVLTIINAVYQYSLDNDGAIPTVIDVKNDNYCASDNGVDVSELESDLVTTGDYLTAIPSDPVDSDDNTDTNEYFILAKTSGRITVCAPNSVGEGNITSTSTQIEVTR
jgi:prepilin-type N-terminal cleavage/methylation domain-containing protein